MSNIRLLAEKNRFAQTQFPYDLSLLWNCITIKQSDDLAAM